MCTDPHWCGPFLVYQNSPGVFLADWHLLERASDLLSLVEHIWHLLHLHLHTWHILNVSTMALLNVHAWSHACLVGNFSMPMLHLLLLCVSVMRYVIWRY